ncbi:MAG: DUF2232 domain-containing protein [Coriobacteriia bacterium]
MPAATSRRRDAVLLSLACVAGAFIAPILPVMGLPLCAAGLGGLIFRGHRNAAALTAVLATVLSAWIRVADVIAVGVALAAIAVAAGRLRRSDVYVNALWFAPVVGAGLGAAEYVSARLEGLSFTQYLVTAGEQTATILGTSESIGGIPVQELTDTMLRLAPSVYLLLGAAVAVPALVAIVWAANRAGAVIRQTPELARVDYSLHVLWPVVIGVGFLAAGRFWGGADGIATTIGMNLLIVMRVVLLVQGMALVAAMLKRAGVRGTGYVAGMVIAFVVDSATWLVSMFGLSDFWVNFRRMKRDSTSDSTDRPLEGL